MKTLYSLRVMNYCKKIIVYVFLLTISVFSYSYANNEYDISHDELIDQRVKNLFNNPNKQWTLMGMTIIENNINKLIKWLVERYDGQFAVTTTPVTEQEKMTASVGRLSQYLCVQKNIVVQQFDADKRYTPDIDNIESKMWVCQENNNLLYQEAIKYYVLPDVGTLQTVYIPLANKLWYWLQWFESYLQGDLLDMQSEQFFFEEHTAVDIVPLMDLTDTKLWRRRKDEFDAMKIIAYVETSNYPFFDDTIMIAILAKKWDNYIKITTPYQKLRYKELWNINALVKELFTRSVEDDVKDIVVSNTYFDTYYYTALKDLHIDDSSLQKNKVRQYLTVLRQNNLEPQWYIDFFVQSLKKDTILESLLYDHLKTLSPFFD